jgi:heat-inducible transcriptional repressor
VLTDRRSAILGLVIDEYIATATPVSSRALVSRHSLNVSTATIRNELARLEEDGYITHPYTSAGRVPSDRGYRHYVEVLMAEEPVGADEQRTIEHQLHQVRGGLDEWLSLTATILATAVESVAVVTRPRAEDARLKHAQLVELQGDLALLVAVMDDGRVRQSMLTLTSPLSQAQLNARAERLNQMLTGADRKTALETAASQEDPNDTRILKAIAELIGEHRVAEETYLDGLQIVLQQPEFHDVVRLRDAVDRLNAYDVRGLVEQAGAADIGETRVLIGEEHGNETMRDWSVVVANYGDGETSGTIAVLGPTRMHYQRSIPRVRYVASLMSSLLHDVR